MTRFRSRRELAVFTALTLAVVGLVPREARGIEDELQDQVAPDSLGQVVDQFDNVDTTTVAVERRRVFFQDATVRADVRNYYFLEDRPSQIKEAWAMGGSFLLQSGYALGSVQVGAQLSTSQKLYGPLDRDGTGLLKPGQEPYTVLGQAYVRLRREGVTLTAGRQALDLRYMNRTDSRMTPQTFEAIFAAHKVRPSEEASGLQLAYGLGYVLGIKKKNEDTFISMSRAVDSDIKQDRGTLTTGARLVGREASLGVMNHFTPDVLNIFHAEGRFTLRIRGTTVGKVTLLYGNQMTVGRNLMGGDDYQTWMWGATLAGGIKSVIVRLGYTSIRDDEAIRSPFGSYPGLSLMISDFDRAGQEAVMAHASFNLESLASFPVSGFVTWARGWDGMSGGEPLPDERELDLTLDFRPEHGIFLGGWIRARYAYLDFLGVTGAVQQLRAILRWDFD